MTFSDILIDARFYVEKKKERKSKREEEESGDDDKENQQAVSFYINKPVKETIFFKETSLTRLDTTGSRTPSVTTTIQQ